MTVEKPVWSDNDYEKISRAIAARINQEKILPDRSVEGIIVELKGYYHNKDQVVGEWLRSIADVLTCPEEDLLLYTTHDCPWTATIAAWRFEHGR